MEQQSSNGQPKPSGTETAQKWYYRFKTAWLVIRILFWVALAGAVIWFGYWLYNRFSVEEVKTQVIVLNDWKAIKAQKVIIGEIAGKATGRYGYRNIIKSDLPFIGPRIDTLGWKAPGSRCVKINGNVKVLLGYDMLKGDKLFSKNARIHLRQTSDSVIVEIVTDYPKPKSLEQIIKTIPERDDSWFHEPISDEEFIAFADTALATIADNLVQKEADFFKQSYAEAIMAIITEPLQLLADQRVLKVTLTLDNLVGFEKKTGEVERKLDDIDFHVEKTNFNIVND